MKNFKTIFKTKAQAKDLTSADMLALCIYRTIKAKSEDKAEILKHFLKKSFSAASMNGSRLYPYHAITLAMYYLNHQIKSGKKWGPEGWYETQGRLLNVEIDEILTEEEQVQFRELATMIEPAFVKAL